MIFIAILLALVAERFLLEQESFRRFDWFTGYLNWLRHQSWGEWLTGGITGIVAVLFPPLLAVGLLQWALYGLFFGVPGLIFATCLLIYCLGPKDLDRQVSDFVAAWDAGEEEEARTIAADLVPEDASDYGQDLARGIVGQACNRIFAVPFWFILLGPLGALLYRLAHYLQSITADNEEFEPEFHAGLQRLLAILNWLPARLAATGYALAGDFHDAVMAWRDAEASEPDSETADHDSTALAAAVGVAALGMETLEREEPQPEHLPVHLAQSALGLVWRSVLIWLAVLVLVTFSLWFG